MIDSASLTRPTIRTPRAAAIAGIAFSLLLGTALVLIRLAIPRSSDDSGEWLSDNGKHNAVKFALNLLPYAGIAFLWFIGVVRSRMGEGEDRLFATVFLGSGLLFVAMLFCAGAVAGGLVLTPDGQPPDEVWTYGRRVSFTLVSVYAMRMAAVFTISTTTIATRLKLAPRWLSALGFVTGACLLFTTGLIPWIELMFPAWVLVLSLHILAVSFRTASPPAGQTTELP